MLSTYNNFKSTLLVFGCLCSSKVKVAACSPIYVGLPQLFALDNASPLEIVKIPTLHLFFAELGGGQRDVLLAKLLQVY